MDAVVIQTEVAKKTEQDAVENSISQLADFQLALIGGGVGEVIVG